MTAPGNDIIQILLALAFVIASGYGCGRIHQWYKHGLERDHAFREGYDHASRSMFDLALQTRSTPPAAPRRADDPAITAARHPAVGLSRRRIPRPDRHRHAA